VNALLAVLSGLIAALAVFRVRYLVHVVRRVRVTDPTEQTHKAQTARGLEIALNVLGICVFVLVSTGGFVFVAVGSVPVAIRVLLFLTIVSFLVLAVVRLAIGQPNVSEPHGR
jgi:hypothetical protein